jgi:molybdate transport system substrate-binding protein
MKRFDPLQKPAGNRISAFAGMVLLTGITIMPAAAAQLNLLASTAVQTVLDEVLAQHERASGDKVAVTIGSSASIMARLKAGETPDMVILTKEGIDELIAQGKVAAGSRAEIASAGLGIAVKRGAPKPDISSVDALKKTLLASRSVAYTATGASGLYFAKLLERLGIAEAMKPKSNVLKSGLAGDVVARGESDLGVQMVSEILAAPGAELVGPLPAEVQSTMVFTAGTLSGSTRGAEAAALVKFLHTPAVGQVFKAKGLDPIAK